MANPILTQVELPSGSTYDLVDLGARDLIAAINNWEYVVCSEASNTPKDVTWDKSGVTITGTLVASATTMYKIYLVPDNNGTNDIYDEYVTVNPSSSTYKWEMFGNTKLPDMAQYVKNKSGHEGGTAGDLAYKDTASGTVAIPKTYTSSTTTATTENKTVTSTGTTTGSVKVTKSVITVSKASSGTSTYTPQGTISTGTGTSNYTPKGSNASSSVSGSCTVTPNGTISTGSGTANYTPAGSIVESTSPSTTIKNPTSKTVVTDMSVADPSSTVATGELVYCSVSGTKLTLKKFVESTGASITTSNVSVKKGDASYTFSGTGAELKFTGTSSTGEISGTAAAQTFTGTGAELKFTGTGARLVTDSDVATDASFVGASMTSTGSVAVPKTYTTTTTTNTTESKTVTVS